MEKVLDGKYIDITKINKNVLYLIISKLNELDYKFVFSYRQILMLQAEKKKIYIEQCKYKCCENSLFIFSELEHDKEKKKLSIRKLLFTRGESKIRGRF